MKRSLTYKIIFIFLSLILTIVFSGFGCKQKKGEEGKKLPEVELNFWGLWDGTDVFDPLISEYQEIMKTAVTPVNIKINYKKFEYPEYEKTIIDSLAAGKGPDIWMIHNTWLPTHKEKLAPCPTEIMTSTLYKNAFVEVTSQDFIYNNQIYAIALSVDTLALYYNKDFFNSAAITAPPSNWDEFKEAVKKLTKFDENDEIIQAGAAIGTSRNINRATDILYLLMLQNGTEMTNEEKTLATLTKSKETKEGLSYIPGVDALKFYTDFADPSKAIYTWNPTLHYSLDAFVEEKVAMIFNYAYRMKDIKHRAPKLNFGVAAVPQIKNTPKEVNFANYWGIAVSSTSQHQTEAWRFLTFLGRKENVEKYVAATGRPASRPDVLNNQLQDPNLQIFAKQALTAKSWYQIDSAKIENLFLETIDSVVLGEKEAEQALKDAEKQINIWLGS